jgi:hypothetical protein
MAINHTNDNHHFLGVHRGRFGCKCHKTACKFMLYLSYANYTTIPGRWSHTKYRGQTVKKMAQMQPHDFCQREK